MPSGPSDHSAGGPRFPPNVRRGLGIRSGIQLEARFEPGPFPVLAVLDPDSSGRRFLLVDAVEEAAPARRLAFLRVLPIDPAGGESSGAASAGRWRQEWEDLWSVSRPLAGLIRPVASIQPCGSSPPVLPPLFFCPKKSALIEAVCPGCTGARDPEGAGSEPLCPACGSPGAPATDGGTPAFPGEPLKSLWKRVREPEAPGEEGSQPFCVSCERRDKCYPAAGPSTETDTAGAILVPISSRPWGGVVVEPFHLPIGAFNKLIAGTTWAAVRRDLKTLPAALLEEVENRFEQERRFLYGPEAGAAFGLESFLLKLETLRQILSSLSRLAVDRGHPHLGVLPETVWVRLEPSDSLRSALWSMRVMLIDVAPGYRGSASGEGADRYLPPAGRPPIFAHPECGDGGDWLEGLCIMRSSTTTMAGAPSPVRVEFLPAVHFQRPPVKGDLVRLAVRGQDPGEGARYLLGRVETSLPEMCRIQVHDASVSPEEVRVLLTRGHGGSNIRMSIVRDHSLVDDLFAAGTLWIASLLTSPADFAAAARFRDELSPRLRGSRPGGGDTAIRESLKAAETSRLFAIQASRDSIESHASGRTGVAIIDRDLMARSLALGMRLCGAVPAGYPGQDHEPVGVEERGRAYDSLLSMVVELGRQAREGMLGSAAPAGGGQREDDEVLAALSAYARERSAKARSRGALPTGLPARRATGD